MNVMIDSIALLSLCTQKCIAFALLRKYSLSPLYYLRIAKQVSRQMIHLTIKLCYNASWCTFNLENNHHDNMKLLKVRFHLHTMTIFVINFTMHQWPTTFFEAVKQRNFHDNIISPITFNKFNWNCLHCQSWGRFWWQLSFRVSSRNSRRNLSWAVSTLWLNCISCFYCANTTYE